MTIAFRSVNPKNNILNRSINALSNQELDGHIDRSYQRFRYELDQGNSRLSRRFEKLAHLQ